MAAKLRWKFQTADREPPQYPRRGEDAAAGGGGARWQPLNAKRIVRRRWPGPITCRSGEHEVQVCTTGDEVGGEVMPNR